MKFTYTLLTCSLLIISSVMRGQIRKGSILLGGSVQYSNSTGEEIPAMGKDRIRSISIGPAIGYALKNNLVLGLSLGYSNGKSNLDTRNFKASGFSGAVFLRQYWNITSKFYAFANAQAGYGSSEGKLVRSDNAFYRAKNKSWNVNASLIPGVAYSVNRKIMLESTFLPLLNVQYGKSDNHLTDLNYSSSNTTKQFRANSSLTNGQTFSLGVRFLL
ncbi:MAG: hypothetical protein ACTHMC_15615 [Pseudobacter sp.]|uniref:hypothetical protein n=1 Tax=Pseudobacter sp. TaxID=2045420 RepID=UPI003F81887B